MNVTNYNENIRTSTDIAEEVLRKLMNQHMKSSFMSVAALNCLITESIYDAGDLMWYLILLNQKSVNSNPQDYIFGWDFDYIVDVFKKALNRKEKFVVTVYIDKPPIRYDEWVMSSPNIYNEPNKYYVKKERDDIDRHMDICNELNDLYSKKNHDYGDSFHQTWVDEGYTMARIRLSDKLSRFKKLTLKDTECDQPKIKSESIRDTLVDLANYAIMTIMELDREKEYDI